ncbi:MAG: hypothetical protein GDYSWBUE_000174 [Candidatus Fervidibacterota bacterium]
MKVLVVGSGGREHALVWKIAQSQLVREVHCAPGNAGIAKVAKCVDISAEDIASLASYAESERIDLTVVGPEAPLAEGIVDEFEKRGLKIFGPNKLAAEIESSKAFCKQLLRKYGIPTAHFEIFDNPDEALKYVRSHGAPIVVKASGLAAGKGSIVCKSIDEAVNAVERIMVQREFGSSGDLIVIEDYLEGEEASVMVFTDGETVKPMLPSQDHKPVFDDDKGPNTGGMGAYCPVPAIDEALFERIIETIIKPTVTAMAEEGRPYKGVLYAGLMLTYEGPKVLEYNCRFGDPETQAVLPLMESDLVPILNAVVEGNLNEVEVRSSQRCCVCVVMASGGYPGKYEKGKVITGVEDAEALEDVIVFHAGTAIRDGQLVTNGGRVLGVTALGDDFPTAIKRAYEAVSRISFDGMHYRRDIGRRALRRLGLA